ncbi:hypothetical protein TWF694_004827 [Orbilia ellipsospora]|uniref:Threonine/serine exporter-like N-terminal domain-containing protein n=1 Tax=Orbilia ellipsospora TaxID=2528407 RepID=A0AAV9WZR6_9PEZI
MLEFVRYPVPKPCLALKTSSGFASATESVASGKGSEIPLMAYKGDPIDIASRIGTASSLHKNAARSYKYEAQGDGLNRVLCRFTHLESDDEVKLRYHMAYTLQKQRYVLQLCKALMLFGAPTHRLEEYLKMSSRVLDIEGQFLYLPGCMIISFDDPSTHTSNMQLVRVTQTLDLGKLQDVHLVYKQVVHDIIGIEEGMGKLEILFKQDARFTPWLQVLVYGAASAAVGPLFSARLIDLPICFFLGSLLGTLALVIAPRSTLYSNVFEIIACVIVSFIARALGSIQGGSVFCFAGIAQASIALILPGYIVLCGALELQSKNLVAGSVRMFYAIIYSLLLGFGITVGTALYGAIDPKATSTSYKSSYQYHRVCSEFLCSTKVPYKHPDCKCSWSV